MAEKESAESESGELKFDHGSSRGWEKWQADRQQAMRELGQRLGLPLGHRVEVWLKDGVRLRGTLFLREELLFLDDVNLNELDLRVGRVTFKRGDLESCVRYD